MAIRGRFRLFLQKLGLLAASLLFTALLAEVAVRFLAHQVLESPPNIYAADPTLGHKLIPSLDREVRDPEWIIRVQANSRGFRDREWTYEKTPGTVRIVGIGDSFLFGYGIPADASVLSHLGRDLALAAEETSTGRPTTVEVINLGLPGHGATQYGITLREEAYRYQPDLVIIFFFMNDFQRTSTQAPYQVDADGFLVRETFSLTSIRSALLPFRKLLKRHSHAYILVRSRLTPLLQQLRLRPMPNPGPLYSKGRDIDEVYTYTLNTLREMNRFCSRRRIDFLVCVIPEKQQVVERFRNQVLGAYDVDATDFDWLRPQRCLSRLAAEEGLALLDFTPVFAEAGKDKTLYFEVDPHWNSAGHQLAAATLLKYIQDHSLLPPLSGSLGR
jgi:lysophospholipase L1-like esterase